MCNPTRDLCARGLSRTIVNSSPFPAHSQHEVLLSHLLEPRILSSRVWLEQNWVYLSAFRLLGPNEHILFEPCVIAAYNCVSRVLHMPSWFCLEPPKKDQTLQKRCLVQSGQAPSFRRSLQPTDHSTAQRNDCSWKPRARRRATPTPEGIAGIRNKGLDVGSQTPNPFLVRGASSHPSPSPVL